MKKALYEKQKTLLSLEVNSGSVQSCRTLRLHGLYSARLLGPRNSPGRNTAVGSLSFLWGIFPTQGSNPGILHCRQILYHLSHQGNPRILGWEACPFSRVSSWPRNRTRVSWPVDTLLAEYLYLHIYLLFYVFTWYNIFYIFILFDFPFLSLYHSWLFSFYTHLHYF